MTTLALAAPRYGVSARLQGSLPPLPMSSMPTASATTSTASTAPPSG